MLFKAITFRRDYEATSIAFRRTDGDHMPSDWAAHWEPATEDELAASGARELFSDVRDDVKMTAYGWL